jgi:hypothetical protein
LACLVKAHEVVPLCYTLLPAERTASTKSLSARSAGQLQAGFDMFDGNYAMLEVHIFSYQS